jgi:Flp pilus assembly protein TadG
MIGLIRKLFKDRRGNALVIVGAALPLVVGSAGLATDTVQWALMKRQVQRAADSAALAGVFGKLSGQTVSNGNCSSSAPISRDLTTIGLASTRLGTTPTCNVVTPNSPWNAATYSAVKVTVSAQPTLAFASLFMTTAPTITASATAAMVQNGKYCMISMDPNAETGISFNGNPNVTLGCGMKTNAKGNSAIDCGGTGTITASPVAAVGYIPTCNNFTGSTTYQSYSPPQTDPYGTINAPAVPGNPNCNNDLAFNGQTTSISVVGTGSWADNTTTVKCYTDFTVGSGKTFTGSDLVIIINKSSSHGSLGNLTLQGTVNCTRCVFILTSDNTGTPTPIGNVDINATAHLNLSAPSAGTYNGILIYQDRRASTCGNWCNHINGASDSVIQGAIYMPKNEVQLNGGSGMNTNCVQIVAWQLQFAGNTSVNNSCPGGPGGFDGYMVRLVE